MTEAFYDDGIVRLLHGDCIALMREMPDSSIDAVVTDAPYGLEFMGKTWDGADGFRRSLNDNDVGRDNVFGRTSATSPEYRTRIPGRGARIQEERADEMTPTGQGHSDSKGPYLAARVDQYIAGHPYQLWCEAWARECLRVLKPGGYLLCFGGTRTVHRLATAIEDAGFQIRDSLLWIYLSGFPKSLDVSKAIDKAAGVKREVVGKRTDGRYAHGFTEAAKKALGATVASESESGFSGEMGVVTVPATDEAMKWDGWGTALKPAWEPIVMARKPLMGTVASNILEFGTGAINIDGCRIPTGEDGGRPLRETDPKPEANGAVYAGRQQAGTGLDGGSKAVGFTEEGRWPSNVLLTDAVFDGDHPDYVVGGGDQESGYMEPGQLRNASLGGGGYHGDFPDEASAAGTYGDTGGKSRFFLIPKAPRSERERGLHGEGDSHAVKLTAKAGAWLCECGRKYARGLDACPRCGSVEREEFTVGQPGRQNTHPTVKPIELMRHLVRMTCRPGGTILDPFVGSGTTALAASEEGINCIGIDQDIKYLEIAVGRLSATPIGMGLSA